SLWSQLSSLQPKHLDPDTLDIEELKQRFLVVQAVEAARTVEDHVIVDPREADVGSILGFGFAPFTGGTLSYIDFMGTKKFVELCHKLGTKYGSRFTPPKLLEDMAAKGETFYGRFPPKKPAPAAASWLRPRVKRSVERLQRLTVATRRAGSTSGPSLSARSVVNRRTMHCRPQLRSASSALHPNGCSRYHVYPRTSVTRIDDS